MSSFERQLWMAHERINERGIPVDVPGLRQAHRLALDVERMYADEVHDITGGVLKNATNNSALPQWLSDVMGEQIVSVAKGPVVEMLERDDLRDDVRRVLEIRQIVGQTAAKKFAGLLNRASADGRVRGCFVFSGAASTGRWASIGVNLQNFFRPKIKNPDELADNIHHMTADDLVMLYGDPMGALGSIARAMLCSEEGKEFRAADWKAVESRKTAYHAGEEWKLDVFRGDGLIYERAAAGIYQVDYTEIEDPSDERQAGKVVDLACGFGGGMGAVMQMASSYGIDMDEIESRLPDPIRFQVDATKIDVEDPEKTWWPNSITRGQAFAELCKRRWRDDNPGAVQAWRAHQDAAIRSIQERGKAIRCDTASPCSYMTFRNGEYMLCKLASGRCISYVRPNLAEGKFGLEVRYEGLNAKTRQWNRKKTYGGDLFQSYVQGSCRDFLARSLVQLDKEGFTTVAHVHDEIIVEQDCADSVHSLDRLKEIMTTPQVWAPDFPLATDAGYAERRYRK